MRCLLLVHNLPERGSYFRALEIGKRLAARGHYVELICTSDEKKYRPRIHAASVPGGVVVTEAPYRTLFNDKQEGWSAFDNSYRLMRALREKWDLVYGFSHKPNAVLPALAAKVRGARVVLDWSDWWGTREGLYQTCVLPAEFFQALPMPIRLFRSSIFAAESMWEPKVYKAADVVTLISEEYLQHPRAPRGLKAKALVMHSGSDLEAVRPMEKTAARKACNLEFPPGAIVLGYLANFHTGERLLLEAFAEICRERDDVWLLAIGSNFEKETPAVHEAIKSRLIHVGRKPFEEVGVHLASADILLLPLNNIALDRARYPHKLSDYVAAGRPIVACEVGETGRLLRRFRFGELTAADARSFAAGIRRAIAQREQWDQTGARVRTIAETEFNWDKLAAGLFEFIRTRTGLKL